jgi:aldehyde dehydrogenase (NAD+)
MEQASKSNLKKVSLELGGKGSNIIFEDANFEEAVRYAAQGIL